MNENPWSILTEYEQPYPSESYQQASNALQAALEHMYLSEIFLQRLNNALIETMTRHANRSDKDQTTSTVRVRILSNCTASHSPESPSSWGFFFIEIDQLIELYLYQDGNP